MEKKRVAVLISGRGSNMSALIEAARAEGFPAEIALVISDKESARGLETATRAGIETLALKRGDYSSRDAHEAAISQALQEHGIDLICLAGYMRLLSADFVGRWQGRVINIHPSLLPLFKGLETHRRALEAGMRIHGCTVHFVNAEMDDGPIIAQAAVPISPDDDEASLSARVLAAEHRLYAHALRLVADGTVRMESGRAVVSRFQPHHDEDRILLSPEGRSDGVDLELLARFTP